MGEPNNNYNARLQDSKIHDTKMIHDFEMVHGCEMIHDLEMVHGCEMIHGDEIVQECKLIPGNEMVHGSEMMHGNEMIHGSKMVNGCEMIPGNDLIKGSERVHGNMVRGSQIISDNKMFHGCELIHGNEMARGSEMVEGSESVMAHVNGAAELSTPTTSSSSRKKSIVWDHFTTEVVSEGCTRACCNLCKQTFAYISGSKTSGTSHLKRHISLCHGIRDQGPPSTGGAYNGVEGTVERLSSRSYRYRGYANVPFDNDCSTSHLANMIILHDYPLHIVQQPAFSSLVESLQPRFKGGIDTIEREVYAVYQKQRDYLVQAFGTTPGRISLTVGFWTTSQTLGYVSLAGQFIDSEWELHRRMLSFRIVSDHSENALSEAICASLSDWNIKDKLFTITLDNDGSSHDIYSANLRDHLSNKNILVLKDKLFVVRCYARILNVVAHDVIASIHSVIYTIRESIKFIKACPSREGKFADIVLQLEIPSSRTLCLDVTTQWNTTYLMLLAALDYRQAFTVLETCDDNYNEAPSAQDWRKVEAACSYLKLLYDSAHSVAAANPTANIFFHEAWKIHLELSNAIAHQDPIFSSIARGIHESFDKFWKDCNLMLSIAVVMDPRFKMKLLEFGYSKIHGLEGSKYVKVVHKAIHDLYEEYTAQPLPLTPAYAEQGVANNRPVSENNTSDGLVDFDIYLAETATRKPLKFELDQYLEEALAPRIPEFDILNWWKLNSVKYPTLSMMARDVLAVPMSMVSSSSSSSIFSSGTCTRKLDDYRSSLCPEIVEALFCAKDWLQYSPGSPSVKKRT